MKERILGRINNVLGYTLFILISLITYNFIPVGAIVGTVAFFAMCDMTTVFPERGYGGD